MIGKKRKSDQADKLTEATREAMAYLGIADKHAVFEPLRDYIGELHRRLGCAVLWARSADWRSFCSEQALDFGNQQVIINEAFYVDYHEDYLNRANATGPKKSGRKVHRSLY